MWVYNIVATIRQGAKAGTDAKVLKAKLSRNWTASFKILAVGPCAAEATPDGRPLAAKFICLDLLNDMPGVDAPCRVSVVPCEPCANHHDSSDLPWFLPAGLTPYVLNSTKSPPYHVIKDDVTVPIERLEIEKITSHRSVRGRGGVIAAFYETHWKDLLQPSWEREMDLQHSRQHSLQYWAGAPLTATSTGKPAVSTHIRVGVDQRELSRNQGARFLSPGYSLVTHQDWTRRFSSTILSVGTHFWYKARDHHWWLGKISAHITTAAHYIVHCLGDPGPVNPKLSSSRYTTAIRAERDLWCLQTRQGKILEQGILRNVDESRGVELAHTTATT